MDDWAQAYSRLTDQKLLALIGEPDALRPEARDALEAEIRQRGLEGGAQERLVSDQQPSPQDIPLRRGPLVILAWTVLTLMGLVALGRVVGSLFFGVLFFPGVAVWLGFITGSWAKTRIGPKSLMGVVLPWASLVTWGFPYLGLFTSTITLRVSAVPTHPARARAFGVIGFIMSLGLYAWRAYFWFRGGAA